MFINLKNVIFYKIIIYKFNHQVYYVIHKVPWPLITSGYDLFIFLIHILSMFSPKICLFTAISAEITNKKIMMLFALCTLIRNSNQSSMQNYFVNVFYLVVCFSATKSFLYIKHKYVPF